MLLKEIVDTQFKERPTNDLRKHDKPDYHEVNGRDYGRFSTVAPKKSDPHMVTKMQNKALTTLEQDAYYCYVKAIVDNGMVKHNPYVPRVYKIVKFKDTLGNEKFKIDMEKLIPFSEASIEEVQVTFKLITGRDLMTSYQKAQYQLLSEVEKIIVYDRSCIDDNLTEVAELLKSIIKNNSNFFFDIHIENVMWRRTPHGLQLVITDPIANREQRKWV